MPCRAARPDPDGKAGRLADQVSNGRFLFGVGVGWNAEGVEDHGTAFKTRFKLKRERLEAMKAIWTETTAEFSGEFVQFGPLMTWPKPAQPPHPPIMVGGAFPHAARRAVRCGDGWVPIAGRAPYGSVDDYLPKFKEMARGRRDDASLPITLFGGAEDEDLLKRYCDMGVARVVTTLPAEGAEQIIPELDRWAALIRRVNG